MTQCDHTLHAIDNNGQTTGTWVVREVGGVRRVACGSCGKVYGRLHTAPHADSESRKRYEEQQRRLACPGCGEDPFID